MLRSKWQRRGTVLVAVGAALSGTWTARYALLHWGATTPETEEPLPGDELLPDAPYVETRAITIDAPREEVWPWIAQLGQGRGGLYSYDWLENIFGCEIHSVDRIVPEWQHVAVGDEVRLHPRSALTVAMVEPEEHLVLRPGPPPSETGSARADSPFDFTWTFVLRHHPGRQTRLVVRERYEPVTGWAGPAIELLAIVSAAMGIKMLRGIRARAESSTV
jgi:hypothetical protein